MGTKTEKGIRMIKKVKGNVWRVEKVVNGFRFDKSFPRQSDAIEYLKTLEAMTTGHSGSNGSMKKIKFGKLALEILDYLKTYRDKGTYIFSFNSYNHIKHLANSDYDTLTDKDFLDAILNARNVQTGALLSRSSLTGIKTFLTKVMDLAEDKGFYRRGRKKLLKEIGLLIKQAQPAKTKLYYRKEQVA